MRNQIVSVEKLLPPSVEMRQVMTMEGLDELSESISRHGLIEPLVVRVEGEMFRIIAGHRRYEAVRRLQIREVPCSIVDVDDETAEELKIHENLKREDVDPTEEADYYMRLYKEKGWSVDDLVRRTGRPFAYIEGRLEMAGWSEDVKAAIQGKHISIAVGRELMKFRDEEVRSRFLHSAADFNASSTVVRSWREKWEAEKLMEERRASGVVDGPAGVAVECPPTLCEFCGEDLSGHIVEYVPVSRLCHQQMQYIRMETEKRRQDAAVAHGAG